MAGEMLAGIILSWHPDNLYKRLPSQRANMAECVQWRLHVFGVHVGRDKTVDEFENLYHTSQ